MPAPEPEVQPLVNYYLRTLANSQGREPEDFDQWDIAGIAAGIRAQTEDEKHLIAAAAIANLQGLDEEDTQYLQAIGANAAFSSALTPPAEKQNGNGKVSTETAADSPKSPPTAPSG